MSATIAAALLEATPALRRLSGEEAPYPGWLHAGTPHAPHTLWVDPVHIPDEVWRCDGDDHLLVPRDIARDGDGHAAVVTHCPERLGEVVRTVSHPGAAVTIAVSVLRAATQARRHGLAHGTWWVDAFGRPVLAATRERPEWRASAVQLLAVLERGAPGALAEALADSAALVARERWTDAEAAACEDRLFQAADPVPLPAGHGRAETDAPAPRLAATLRRELSAAPDRSARRRARPADGGWAERVRDTVRTVAAAPGRAREWLRRRRARPSGPARPAGTAESDPPRRRSRAPWVLAAALATVVLAVGLMWPAEDGARAGADAPTPTRSTASAPTPGPMPSPTLPAATAPPPPGPSSPAAPSSATGLEGAATAVIGALASCTSDAAACAELMEAPGSALPEGVVSLDAQRTVRLIDEYGGVAVFRVEAQGHAAQILVLVSANGKWLVRDVYDVADQP